VAPCGNNNVIVSRSLGFANGLPYEK